MAKLVLLFVLSVLATGYSGVIKEEPGSQDWWKTAVFYQIYPRSFKDDSNDGIGDLKGITSKLQHLQDIGVTATWLSPIFKSPQVDQGYDISDYRTVDPDYGTIEDLLGLIKKAKDLGIKIILDFVPNHTSDQHEWFQKSLAGDEEYKDYYIWREGKNNNTEPPNNWISNFKGPAWTYREERGLWYYHNFAAAQPDLNYRNPKLVQSMKDILTYWLEQGITGFRIDAVPYLFEDEEFKDEPRSDDENASPNDYEYLNHIYTQDLNETLDMIYQWRDLVDNYTNVVGGDARILMTEAYTNFNTTLLYYGLPDGSRLGAHFTFNFDFITSLKNTSSSADIKNVIDNWLTNLPKIYTYNWVLGNHDQHRVATRFGVEHIDALNMLQSVLPGVQVNYNGEEFGMENGQVTCEEGHDPQAIKNCSIFDQISRDFERTPFQWDSTTNAGFNEGATPWLPVSDKYLTNNVALQSVEGKKSHLSIFKSLVNDVRKNIPSTATTETQVLKDAVLVVSRVSEDKAYHLLYNRLGGSIVVDIPYKLGGNNNTILASSLNSQKEEGSPLQGSTVSLNGYESFIFLET